MINQLIQTIKTKGTLLTHKDPDVSLGVEHFFCSTFVPSENLLIKGEYDNPNSETRKAMLVFLNPDTNQVKGGWLSLP